MYEEVDKDEEVLRWLLVCLFTFPQVLPWVASIVHQVLLVD